MDAQGQLNLVNNFFETAINLIPNFKTAENKKYPNLNGKGVNYKKIKNQILNEYNQMKKHLNSDVREELDKRTKYLKRALNMLTAGDDDNDDGGGGDDYDGEVGVKNKNGKRLKIDDDDDDDDDDEDEDYNNDMDELVDNDADEGSDDDDEDSDDDEDDDDEDSDDDDDDDDDDDEDDDKVASDRHEEGIHDDDEDDDGKEDEEEEEDNDDDDDGDDDEITVKNLSTKEANLSGRIKNAKKINNNNNDKFITKSYSAKSKKYKKQGSPLHNNPEPPTKRRKLEISENSDVPNIGGVEKDDLKALLRQKIANLQEKRGKTTESIKNTDDNNKNNKHNDTKKTDNKINKKQNTNLNKNQPKQPSTNQPPPPSLPTTTTTNNNNNNNNNKDKQTPSPRFNKEQTILYSKFEFPSDAKKGKKHKTFKDVPTGKNYDHLLAKITKQEEKLKQLQSTDSKSADDFRQKLLWKKALAKCEGLKVKDDEQLIRKSINKKMKRKQVTAKRWEDREERVKMKMANRQKKRKENIRKKADKRIKKKINKRRNK